MTKVLITESYLEGIGDGIRYANGGSDTYKPSQMEAAIRALKKTLVHKTVTVNSTYYPADDDADGYNSVTVNVSGGSWTETEIYAITDFTPNANANTTRSGGILVTPIYDLKCAGVRFWARNNACNVYISDTSGNTIASKLNATVTADQWNAVYLDAPVVLNKNTQYLIWGCNESSTMKYVATTAIRSNFVTIGNAMYSTSNNTFPTNNETGSAKYGVNLIIQIGL